MFWIVVLVAIAVAGLVMAVCYAVWLAHKLSDVWSEVGVLTERGAQLADLVAQIGPPAALPGPIEGNGLDRAPVAARSPHLDVR
jgi:hypothetical protein